MTRKELDDLKIEKPSDEIYCEIKAKWDNMAKPLDGMGRFEEITARIGAIQGNVNFDIGNKAVIVMCADNGIVEENISQSGQEVTMKVASALGRNATCVGKMAKSIGAKVVPVDIGISSDGDIKGVVNKKIAKGTRNFLKEPAMTEEEMLSAIQTGIDMVACCKDRGINLIAAGEMGIGNTTTAGAMAAALTGADVALCAGRGAGLSDAGLVRKKQVIAGALNKYKFEKNETYRILQTVGGLDIAGMVGIFLGGAILSVPVVMDGVISMAAALTAIRIDPAVRSFMIPSHRSRERVASIMAEEMGITPVIDASMALGEGTGAVMMFALLDMAAALYREHSSFDDYGMERYTRF